MKNNQLVPYQFQDARAKVDAVFDNLDVRQSTIKDYKYRIPLFLDFVQKNGFHRNTLLEFKRTLTTRTDLAVSTKNKFLITAKIFLRELARLGTVPDITQNIKTFSQNHKHKKDGICDQEMQRIVERLHQLPPTPQTARLRAMVALLALQGLRQIEVVRLDVGNVDLVANTAMVQGKGDDDKELVYLHPETTKALTDYLKSNKVADGALFFSQSNSSRNHRLTTRAIRNIVGQTLTDLGIEKTTHGFRHYFTSTLLKTYKGDLLEVARYTRHKTLEMLTVYNDNIKQKADLPRFYGAFEIELN